MRSARALAALLAVGAALAAGFAVAGLAAGNGEAGPEVGVPGQATFDREIVDQGDCAQTMRVNGLADVNGDGRPDILVAGESGVFWFDNQSLACHVVARGRYGEGSTIFGLDVNRDGRTDIVTGDKDARTMVWFENTPGGDWPEHLFSTAAYCHNVTFSDISGDGIDDMGCVDPDHATVSWLEAPQNPNAPWKQHVIDRDRPAWGAKFADIDGDGRVDLVAGRAWYRNTGADSWPRYAYTDREDRSRPNAVWFSEHFNDYEYLSVVDLNDDGRLDVVAVLFSGTPEGELWAFLAPADPTTQPWTAVEIDAGPLFSVHSLDVGDFDGSGRVQVMVGEMEIAGYGFGSTPDPRLLLYRLDGDPSAPSGWTRLVLDHLGTHEALTADFDGDGRPDIVGGDENSELATPPRTGRLVVWRNTTDVPGSTTGETTTAEPTAAETTTVTRPVSTSAPAVSGLAVVGQTLAATSGTWSSDPTAVAYEWQRCDENGSACAAVAAAADATYDVTAADVGSTLRVKVTATFADGDLDAFSQPSPVVATPNLALDPGFESDPGAAYFTYGPGTFGWASQHRHGGGHSLRIVSRTSELARWLGNTKGIRARPGTAYAVSVYARTAAVANRAGLSVNFWDADGRYIPATVESATTLSGSEDWTRLALQATAPAAAAFLRVEFRLNGPGSAWFDDLTVSER